MNPALSLFVCAMFVLIGCMFFHLMATWEGDSPRSRGIGWAMAILCWIIGAPFIQWVVKFIIDQWLAAWRYVNV